MDQRHAQASSTGSPKDPPLDPPLDPRTTRHVLAGYSGVDLTLIEHQGGTFVRKQARRPDQNERLRAQAAKLAWAHDAGFPCPALRGDGAEAERYWFDMDYVPGESLANGLVSGRAIDWSSVAAQVRTLLERMALQAGPAIEPAVFARKLSDIGRRCAALEICRSWMDRIDRTIASLRAMDWSGLPGGPCHGDMTLENILLRQDGSLMFIDFDVPEPGSFVLDIAKIYQDLSGQWFLRQLALRDPDGVDLLNARLNLARAVRHFDAALVGMMPQAGRVDQLAAFHLLRTLPYATDSAVPGYVLDRANALLRQV